MPLALVTERIPSHGMGPGRPVQEIVNLEVLLSPGTGIAGSRFIGAAFTLNLSLRPSLTPI
jgi:hypothetical protein